MVSSPIPDVAALARVFRALGDESRLRIVALLVHGELCVCHLVAALGLSQPNTSRHLGILRAAGLVEVRREGGWAHYRLAAQLDRGARAVLDALVAEFCAARALRADHARLVQTCGPSCG